MPEIVRPRETREDQGGGHDGHRDVEETIAQLDGGRWVGCHSSSTGRIWRDSIIGKWRLEGCARGNQKRRAMYSRIWCFQYGQSWPPSGPQLSREWRMPLLARISERR